MGPPSAKSDQVNAQRPPQDPSNGIPPGLDAKQAEVKEALSSLSGEQKAALKSALDELKPQTENMSLEEIGDEFLNILTQLTQDGSDSESEYQVDTYI